MIAAGDVFAQKRKKSIIKVEYFKNHNKTESLVVTLRVKEKQYVPLSDAVVQFYCINDTSNVLLDKINTNEKGQAIIAIDDNPNIFKDTSRFVTFEVEYNGDTTIKGAKSKIAVKQADLEVSFFQKDTIKSIEVNAKEIGLDDQNTPIKDLDISFYIKGTFSLLNFGKEKTDEKGNTKIEFPVHMPGDTAGVLTIVVRIEEEDTYGTIETRGEINWGTPIQLPEEKHRGLGDTDAPLWMVYTLITLLSAVWFHYLYVIFLIVKIKLMK